MIRLNFRRGSAFASKKIRKYLETVNVEDVQHIIVIRHAAIGDFMVIRPFLIQLKQFFPNTKITLNVLRNSQYGIPYDLIDDVHIVDKYNPDDKNKKASLFNRVQQAKTLPKADLLFDLTDSSLSLLLSFFAQSKVKVGYSYRALRRTFYDVSLLRSDFVLETHSALHMLNILGNKSLELDYGFKKRYEKKLKKRIVYFAGASIKEKCWEEHKYKKCIEKLSATYNDYDHIILQGIKENEKFLDIYKPLQNIENIVLQSSMELDETMQFLADSALVLSNDTGIRNMAIAVETPTVGIFFLTGPFRYWPRVEKHECVFNKSYMSPSTEEVCISVKKVMEKIYE
jgi:ADP-heptose:LPS heptosyltransferase